MESRAIDKIKFVQNLLSHDTYDHPLERPSWRGLALACDLMILNRIEQIRLMRAPEPVKAFV